MLKSSHQDRVRFMMIKDKNIKKICFNKSAFVQDNLKSEKKYFLGHAYGEGMFLQNPSEALAFAFISAHKKMLTVPEFDKNSKYNPVSSLIHDVKLLMDFHENYSIKEFKKAVDKTYFEEFEDSSEFISRLEKNIVVKGSTNHVNELIKRRIMSQVKEILIFDKKPDKSAIAVRLLAVKSVPEGFLKIDLLTEALETVLANQSWSESLFSETNIFSNKSNKRDLNIEIDAQHKASKNLIALINQSEKISKEELLNCRIYKDENELYIQ